MGFARDTYSDPAFDQELYLIAVDRAADAYAGLARAWNRPSGPWVGLIGTVAAYRRRGLHVGCSPEC